jgi:hypothetical protein
MKLEFVSVEARETIQKTRFSPVVTSLDAPNGAVPRGLVSNRTVMRNGRAAYRQGPA